MLNSAYIQVIFRILPNMLVNLYANDLLAEIFQTAENNDGIKRDFEIFDKMTFCFEKVENT